MLLYFGIVIFLMIMLFLSTAKEEKEISGMLKGDKLSRDAKNYKNFSIIVLFCCLFFFWFLTAFRASEIGNDTTSYIGYFYTLNKYGINENLHIELGYQYFNLLIGAIYNDAQFFLVVCATISYVAIAIYIIKYSKNILFSLVLTFCVCFSIFTNLLRQNFAMIIVLYAYQLMKKGKSVWAIILIAIASTFHATAWGALLLFFHKHYPYDIKVVVPIALIVIALSMTGAINNILRTLISEYSEYFDKVQAGSGWIGIAYYCLRNCVFYGFVYKAYKKTKKENSLILCNFFLLLIIPCFGFSLNLFNRASEYFLLIAITELPNTFSFDKRELRSRNIWIIAIGLVMLAYFLVATIIRPEWNYLYPYKFFWSK